MNLCSRNPFLTSACAVALSCAVRAADTWYVSADMSYGADIVGAEFRTNNLQHAIDVSASGDTIMVEDGFVVGTDVSPANETARLTCGRKALTIRAENGDWRTGPVVYGAIDPDTSTYHGMGSDARCALQKTSSENLTVVGFTFRDAASQSSASGGCVTGSGTDYLTLENCRLINGAADKGGGAYRAKLVNCIVSDCFAHSNGGGCSGCVVVGGAVSNCTVQVNNTTCQGTGGGGVHDSVVSNCLIACNQTLTRFSGGQASSGGGAYLSDLYGCVISNNVAYGNGGGVVDSSMSGCTNMFNFCHARGGGCFGTGTITNSLIVCNTSEEAGGGVAFQAVTTAVLVDCIISNNVTMVDGSLLGGGGGIWANNSCSGVTIEKCLITHNKTIVEGGGVYGADVIKLSRCTVSHNEALKGGGISNCDFNDGVIADNTASMEGGGSFGVNSLLIGSRISGNSAVNNGGGVSGGVVSNCTVACNISATAKGMFGGAVSDATVYGSFITNNCSYGQSGGGCRECTTYNCVIRDNVNAESTSSVVGRGGGGVIGGSHYNALISGNISGTRGSGARSAVLYNCTVVGNVGTNSAADSSIYECTLVNTIVWGNLDSDGAPAEMIINAATNSCVEMSTLSAKCVGCINTDPRFADAASGDFRPKARACRDSALAFDWMLVPGDIRSKDLAGLERIIGKAPDMGCYEAESKGMTLIFR